MDRMDELRWQWRMLVLDLLLHIADDVRGSSAIAKRKVDRYNDLTARAERLRAAVAS